MIKKKFIIFLSIFAIISIFHSCSPTPVNTITDANMQSVSGNFTSYDKILGTANLVVSIGSGATLQVGFTNTTTTTTTTAYPMTRLTNISGTEGVPSYTFQSGTMSASVRVADENTVYVTVVSLREPYFTLNDVECVK